MTRIDENTSEDPDLPGTCTRSLAESDPGHRKGSILLVEDYEAYAKLVLRASDQVLPETEIHWVPDGKQAMDFLGATQSSTRSDSPSLVLLDMTLPGMSGLEVLQRIRCDIGLRRIPVVMFSSSTTEAQRAAAYDAHANGYLGKPTNFDQLCRLMADLHRYWIRWNEQPPEVLGSLPEGRP